MALPKVDRAAEYATKALELVTRLLGEAPEQRGARRLAEQTVVGTSGERAAQVMILSPRDWAAHVQYEAVIAHALRLRGAEVTFVSCGGRLEICDRANVYEAPPMPCHSCARYTTTSIDAHGFPVRLLNETWSTDNADWPELDLVSVPDLKQVEHDGLSLGRLVDIPLKWFLCAADVEGDPLAGVTSRAFLRSARRIADSVDRLLDELRPDVVLLLNGLFLFEAVTWARCRQRGIDVVTYERAFRQGTLVFHRGVPAGFYDFGDDFAALDRPLTAEEDEALTEYLVSRRKGGAFDQYWRFQEKPVDAGEGRLVTLFTNLTWDTAVIDRDVAFVDIQAWLRACIEIFAARPEHRLVIRVHPSELALPGKRTRDSLAAYIARTFPDLPGNITVISPDDMTSSYPLMDASDFGLIYTSTTGLEMALAGRPVIVAGETHYRGKGFTEDVSDAAEFADAVERGLADPRLLTLDSEAARRYAHFFFFRAPIPAPGVIEPHPGLARLTIERLDELAPGMNPAVDRICDGLLGTQPFVTD
jgi:hypothetical protein